MKKFFVSKKGILTALCASALLVVPFTASELTARKINSVKNLSSGSTTCFTRVGQTFTALMIGDYASTYLAKDFVTTTGECFAHLNKSFENVFAGSFIEAKKPLNKLTSDMFWFHEKTQKLAEMANNGEVELSSNSTILNKFSSLEALNMDLQEKLDQKASAMETWRSLWSALALLGALAISFLALVSGRSRQKERDSFERFNQEAKDILENSGDLDKTVLKAGRLMEHLFLKVKSPYCFELYNRVQADLLENGSSFPVHANKAYEEASSVEAVEAGEVADFGSTSRALVDRMNDKVFTHGILLDQNLDEDFWIRGNSESLEQLLYNLLSFAVENSLHHNSGRRISVKSKALGGISYFKTRISNYLLNPTEMEVFNGGAVSGEANVNLLLMKEIAADMGVSIAAKNILNGGSNFTGAEIEVVFTRAKVKSEPAQERAPKVSKILKGRKKDILKALRSEA